MLDHPLDIRPTDAPASEPVTFAWHFLPAPGPDGLHRLTHDDNRIVRVGETLSVACTPRVGYYGLHASADALRALGDAPGFTLCRVALWGDVDEDDDGRIAGRYRRVLWMVEGDAVRPAVLAFAADEAERALNLAGNPDVRSVAAVEAVRAHLRGEHVDLKAAQEAAGAAAWAVAAGAGAEARAAAWAVEAAAAAAGAAAWAAARAVEAAVEAEAEAEAEAVARERQALALNAILFALAPTPMPDLPDPVPPCPACANQPKGPRGYIQWHDWAARMVRTHRVRRCKACKRFTVWIPRKSRNLDA